MRVLAIDSAMNGCSACVCETAKTGQEALEVLAGEALEMTKGHAEHLMPMIERVMEKAGTTYNALDLIGVTNGPGAFTGMRIAIATAKALALAAGKPVIGVSTFSAVLDTFLNAGTPDQRAHPYYALILETKRKDYYFQLYENKTGGVPSEMKTILPYAPATVAVAANIRSIISKKSILLVGDATKRFMEECGKSWPHHVITMPDCASVAKLAIGMYGTQKEETTCKPVYLRGAEIGKSGKKQRKMKA